MKTFIELKAGTILSYTDSANTNYRLTILREDERNRVEVLNEMDGQIWKDCHARNKEVTNRYEIVFEPEF